jgi:hypothetical protein
MYIGNEERNCKKYHLLKADGVAVNAGYYDIIWYDTMMLEYFKLRTTAKYVDEPIF